MSYKSYVTYPTDTAFLVMFRIPAFMNPVRF